MPESIPEHCDTIALPSGDRVVIYPISYKLARQFKSEIAKLASSAGGGPEVMAKLGLDDKLLDLLDNCTVPKLSEIENVPVYLAAEALAKWVNLNLAPDRWSFTKGLLEELINRLTGQTINLSQIWSAFASQPATPAPTSITSPGPSGLTLDGVFPSSTAKPIVLPDSWAVSVPP